MSADPFLPPISPALSPLTAALTCEEDELLIDGDDSPFGNACDVIQQQGALGQKLRVKMAGLENDRADVVNLFLALIEIIDERRLLSIPAEKFKLHLECVAFHARLVLSDPGKPTGGHCLTSPEHWLHYVREVLPFLDQTILDMAKKLSDVVLEMSGASAERMKDAQEELDRMSHWLANHLSGFDLRHLTAAAIHNACNNVHIVNSIDSINAVLQGTHPRVDKAPKLAFTSAMADFLFIQVNDILDLCSRMGSDPRMQYKFVAF